MQEPRNNFLPGAGKLSYMRVPEITTGAIRIETGVREKDQVSVHYDPMIAKLIVWGEDRKEALAILRSKLNDYNVSKFSNGKCVCIILSKILDIYIVFCTYF